MNELFKSELIDMECKYINEKCLQECICSKTLDNNIIKKFFDKDSFYWEKEVYLALVERDIVPLASPRMYTIVYHTHNMMSLRSILKNKDCHKKLILNEVFNFVGIFNKINFIHGNLHIDNIFVDKDNRFYILDLTNSYYDRAKGSPKYKRRSFPDFKYNKYLDIFTLYISLKLFFRYDLKYIQYIDSLINIYISDDKIVEMLNKMYAIL